MLTLSGAPVCVVSCINSQKTKQDLSYNFLKLLQDLSF